MTWTWEVPQEPRDPVLAADLIAGWPTREAAEAWLEYVYDDLVYDQIKVVTLMNGHTPIYDMGLEPQ